MKGLFHFMARLFGVSGMLFAFLSAALPATPASASSNVGTEITINTPTNGQTISGRAVTVGVTQGPDVYWDQLMIDGTAVLSGYGNFTWNSVNVANGTHTLMVRVFQKGGATPLGTAYVSAVVNNSNATPSVSPTPAPTPVPTATPKPSCVTITSPNQDATVSGSVPILTNDFCSGNWFESLFVDSVYIGDFKTNGAVFTSTNYANGNHLVEVSSQTMNPGSKFLGAANVTLNVKNSSSPTPTPNPSTTPAPTRSPSPTATPIPSGHFSFIGPASTLPSESSCAAAVNASPLPEHASWNQNDGTGYNSNQIVSTPSYFYTYVGNQIGYPNADFKNVDGNYAGTTDDILRWVSCKWGVDEDWVRAESQEESGWHQDCADMHGGSGCNGNGDYNNPDGTCSGLPTNLSGDGWQVTDSGGNYVGSKAVKNVGGYASWGIVQSKVACAEYYSWPMIALSTSWGSDYRWAKFHSCVTGGPSGRFNSIDYNNAVSRAKSSPNSLVPGGQLGPTNLLSNETNLQYLALGCIGTHFSGGWYGSSAVGYLTTSSGSDSFIPLLSSHAWPGGLY
jgi:hypothetical protein